MNQREIKFHVLSNLKKPLGLERLNGTKWEWTCFDLNPPNKINWVPGVFSDINGLIRRQFTGLKDKNGKEIYEGDILSCIEDGKKWDKNVAVKFSSGGFNIYSPDCCKVCESGWGCICDLGEAAGMFQIEVIGNIYENPELLSSAPTVKKEE